MTGLLTILGCNVSILERFAIFTEVNLCWSMKNEVVPFVKFHGRD